jgi:hypothetical protein
MWMKCPVCGTRTPIGWILLGLPGRKYTCTGCRSRIDGTVYRFVATSVSVGVLGYTLFKALKGNMNPLFLVLALALALALTFVNFPWQLKTVERSDSPTHPLLAEDGTAAGETSSTTQNQEADSGAAELDASQGSSKTDASANRQDRVDPS